MSLDLTGLDAQLEEIVKADRERYDRWVAEHGYERRQMRRAIFYCCPDVLTAMSSGRFEVIARPLPRYAKRVATFYDPARDQFGVVVESEEFDAIYEGEKLPILEPMIFKKLDG